MPLGEKNFTGPSICFLSLHLSTEGRNTGVTQMTNYQRKAKQKG